MRGASSLRRNKASCSDVEARFDVQRRLLPSRALQPWPRAAGKARQAPDNYLGGRWIGMRMDPERRGRLINRQLGLPLPSRRDDLMRSAVGCSRGDQPMPIHGDGFRDIIADLRDHLLATPQAYRRPEIGSVDAIGGRLAVAHKSHRAGSGVEPDRPAGVGSELSRNWKRWPRAILRMHLVWAELCDRPGDAREKHCSARELNHHFLPDLCAYGQRCRGISSELPLLN